jgi:hypothetical protein
MKFGYKRKPIWFIQTVASGIPVQWSVTQPWREECQKYCSDNPGRGVTWVNFLCSSIMLGKRLS